MILDFQQCLLEGRGVGVVPDQTAPVDCHAVDGADAPGFGTQRVELADDGLLVGDGDVESVDVLAIHPLAYPLDRGGLVQPVVGIREMLRVETTL